MPFKLRRGGRDGMDEQEITSKDVIGLTEDELKAKLDAPNAAVTELKTQLETQNTALEAIKSSLAGLEGRLTKPAGNENEGTQDEVDPATRLSTFAVQTSMETKVDVVKSKLRNATDTDGSPKYPYWDAFEVDMLKLTEKDSLAAKTQEAYWDNVYSIIFARKYKDIQAGTIKAKRTMYIETGTSHAGNETVNDNQPTELDKIQAAKFKIPIEKYMETKKGLTFVR